jgi:hypothetical protein
MNEHPLDSADLDGSRTTAQMTIQPSVPDTRGAALNTMPSLGAMPALTQGVYPSPYQPGYGSAPSHPTFFPPAPFCPTAEWNPFHSPLASGTSSAEHPFGPAPYDATAQWDRYSAPPAPGTSSAHHSSAPTDPRQTFQCNPNSANSAPGTGSAQHSSAAADPRQNFQWNQYSSSSAPGTSSAQHPFAPVASHPTAQWNPYSSSSAPGTSSAQHSFAPVVFQPAAQWNPYPSLSLLTSPLRTPNPSQGQLPELQGSGKQNFSTKNGSSSAVLPANRHSSPKAWRTPPTSSADYCERASKLPASAKSRQTLLVILDLNGTLVYRPNRRKPHKIIRRTDLNWFLDQLFAEHKVMIWSSAKRDNVNKMIQPVLTSNQRSLLVAKWTREDLGLRHADFNKNVQVFKQLSKVWSNEQIQMRHPNYAEGGRWGQHNTVLLDDSALKAAAEPYNLIEVPEFDGTVWDEDPTLMEVWHYLKVLRGFQDVSAYMRLNPFVPDSGVEVQEDC